jgi:hypothetical protein
MLLNVKLTRFLDMMAGLNDVTMRHIGVMVSLLVTAGFILRCRFTVMACCFLKVRRGCFVVLCTGEFGWHGFSPLLRSPGEGK